MSPDDLEKERGAVMEEYRGTRNANGRMQDAHWVLMMEGSKVTFLALLDFCQFHLSFSTLNSDFSFECTVLTRMKHKPQ